MKVLLRPSDTLADVAPTGHPKPYRRPRPPQVVEVILAGLEDHLVHGITHEKDGT
jgi:hypothetical protein